MVLLGRSVPCRRGRLLLVRGPLRRHDQGQRFVGFANRDRVGPHGAPRGGRERRGRDRSRRIHENQSLRDHQRRLRGRPGSGGRAPGALQEPPAALPVSAHDRVRARAAQDRDRKDPALQAPRARSRNGPGLVSKHIAVLPCDGAGKEVVPEAIKVLTAAGARFEYEEFDINADAYLRTKVAIPAEVWSQLEKADAILFGAVGDPRVPDAEYLAGVLLRLRFELDLYVNLRPAKLYDDRLSPLRREDRRRTDLLIVRENTEGLYVGMGGRFKKGSKEEIATQEDVNTHLGVTRIIEHAFQVAKREVVMVDKSNAMTFAGGLWQDRWKAVAAAHPRVKTRHLLVDAAAMQLVKDPSQFDVIVTGNLFGDILSDLTAELVGGMGIAPSANINPASGRGLFEPVHGTAPDIAGKALVNPVGAILSAAMMVRQLGVPDMANAIEGAVESAIRARQCTRDIGGDLSTSQAGDAIVKRLGD